MTKKEWLKKYRASYEFRVAAARKGIKVIQDNVIFFNPDGTVKYVAGSYVV